MMVLERSCRYRLKLESFEYTESIVNQLSVDLYHNPLSEWQVRSYLVAGYSEIVDIK